MSDTCMLSLNPFGGVQVSVLWWGADWPGDRDDHAIYCQEVRSASAGGSLRRVPQEEPESGQCFHVAHTGRQALPNYNCWLSLVYGLMGCTGFTDMNYLYIKKKQKKNKPKLTASKLHFFKALKLKWKILFAMVEYVLNWCCFTLIFTLHYIVYK